MATSNSASSPVGTRGLLTCALTMVSQDPSINTSYVRVEGRLRNESNINIHGHVTDGWIDGFKSSDDGPFNYNIDPGSVMTFTEHEFSCKHDDRGDLTVNFRANYGFSGDGSIGNNQSQWCGLDLPHIDVPPTRPQNPAFSQLTATSVRLSWDVPHDDGGKNIQGYTIERYNGLQTTGTPVKYGMSSSTSRNLTDLKPGQSYTYLIYAHNNAQYNKGVSDPSVPLHVLANTGVFVRVGGQWVTAAPYIRVGGVWQLATTSVRRLGIWKPTNS